MRLAGWLVVIVALSAAAEAREFSRLAIVGDSVNLGVNPDYDPARYGWSHMLLGVGGPPFPPTRETTLFSLWPHISAWNASVSGSRASAWAAPGSPHLEPVLTWKPDLVVLLVGGWDVIDALADGVVSVAEMNRLRADLSAIVTRLQENDPPPQLVMLTYYDLFDGYSHRLPVLYANYRPMSQATLDGNAFLRQLAAERGAILVDLYPEFLHRCYGRAMGDPAPLEPAFVRLPFPGGFDIHPNTAGHERIYQRVLAALARLKAEPPRFTAESADLDGSGTVDEADLALLLALVKGGSGHPRSLLSFAGFWGATGAAP